MKTCSGRLFRVGRKPFPLVLAAVFSLSSCGSPVPIPTTYPLSFQQKMQSASHWQTLAQDIWQEVSTRLEAGGYHETMLGLEPPEEKTPFTKALNNFLFTEIVNHGVAVSPSAHFTLTYEIQVVHYSQDRDNAAVPGMYTGLAAAGALAGEGVQHGWGATSAIAAGVPIAAGADLASGWMASSSLTELIVTFSVVDQKDVRIRESKVYYVDDGDQKLYEAANPKDDDRLMKHLISSNWYADDPMTVKDIGAEQDKKFDIIINKADGPIRDVNAATKEAAQRCADKNGQEARFISQGYPTNNRMVIKATYECF